MLIRPLVPHDLPRLTELAIETFRPFYEDSFRPLVGEVVFANQHGNWRDDYRRLVAGLDDPGQYKYVAVAEAESDIAGYVAWSTDPARRKREHHDPRRRHTRVHPAPRRRLLPAALTHDGSSLGTRAGGTAEGTAR